MCGCDLVSGVHLCSYVVVTPSAAGKLDVITMITSCSIVLFFVNTMLFVVNLVSKQQVERYCTTVSWTYDSMSIIIYIL